MKLDPKALLPCPFCGGVARLLKGGASNCFVRCDDCSAGSADGSEERIVAKWNRRNLQPSKEVRELVERLRENIIADAFERYEIVSGRLAERLIRERLDAADLLSRMDGEGWRPIETVYVVGGTVGEWSDRSEWTVGVWVSEADAKAFVERIDAMGREFEQAVHSRNSNWNDETDAATDRAAEACRAVEPGWSDYCGEAPRYTCWPERLIPPSPSIEDPTP